MESPAALDVGLRERFNSANSGGGWCVKTHTRTHAHGSRAHSNETGYCINSVQNSNY